MSPDKPNPFVYDIEQSESDAKRVYGKHTALLHELCCYGSNLLIRTFPDKNNKLHDYVILACLLRQFLIHFDAAFVLLEKGCAEGAYIHLRAMLEEEFYFKFLFQKETQRRAMHFYVWNLRRHRRSAQLSNPTSIEAQNAKALFGARFQQSLDSVQTPEFQTKAKAEIARIDGILAQPEYAPINHAFEILRKGRDYDVDWYRPLGPTSIRKLATDVGEQVQYRFFYSKWSQSMHSSAMFEHFYSDDTSASLEQVRNVAQMREPLQMAALISVSVFRMIVERYRPGEIANFNRKWESEWQQRALNFPPVTVMRLNQEYR